MKTALITLSGLFALALMEPSFSKDRIDLHNDPTYSTHNYKQVNKAQMAQRWEAGSAVNVPVPSTKNVMLADYKKQTHWQPSSGTLTTTSKSPNAVAGWNYKTQHVVQPLGHENSNHKSTHQHHRKAV